MTKVFRASRKSEDSDNLTSKVIRGNIRFYYCKVNVSIDSVIYIIYIHTYDTGILEPGFLS